MSTPAPARPSGLMFKLSVMMFLQFFIWGAWFELAFSYIPALKFPEAWMTSLVFGAFNVGAVVALFFSTQLADRKFAAQKFLSFSHLVGGLAILGLYFLQAPVGMGVGQVSSVKVLAKDTKSNSGIGDIPNGPRVVVSNLTTEDKATEYWAKFDAGVLAFEKATPEERKENKLDDPRRVVTFVVTDSKPDLLTGDAKTPLAPFWPFFALMLIHSIFYVPTISITNAIAFNAFINPDKQFGPVRLWGTIGWIAASWPFLFLLADWSATEVVGATGFIDKIGAALGNGLKGAEELNGQRYIFLVAGAASLLLSAFSWLLPHTPPRPATGEDSLAWVKAAKYLAKPFVLVLFIVTFIDAAVHQSFFVWTPDYLKSDRVGVASNWVPAVMKIGQLAEIVTMLALGYVLKTFGWRITMIVGVLGHAGRFAVFAYVPQQEAVILINVLHGVCYAFFFATVYIFVDTYFPKDVRSSAQGLFNLLILGVGPFAANFACGELRGKYTEGGALNYPVIFQYSMYAATAGAVLLLLFFHPPKKGGDTPAA